ncbi:vesicle-associated membrane protein 5-like [Mustelus asterias]
MGTRKSDIIKKIQDDADEVLEVMLANTEKVKERGENLEVLGDRAEQLMEAGKVFQKTAKEVEKQERFANRKWKIILGVTVGLVILIIIIVIICTIPSSRTVEPFPASSTAKPLCVSNQDTTC